MLKPVVVHTVDHVLHPAAREDFCSYIRHLLDKGDKAMAELLWGQVAEVQHLPPVEGVLDVPGMRRLACTASPCRRCDERRGGFTFPWLGLWSRREVLVLAADSPADAWRKWSESAATLDLLQLQFHGSGLTLGDLCPLRWCAALDLTTSAWACASGSDLMEAWRAWQLGSVAWIEPLGGSRCEQALGSSQLRAGRAMHGWLRAAGRDPGFWLPASCQGCGALSRWVCVDCGISTCRDCQLAKDAPPCCPTAFRCENDWMEIPALRRGQRDVHTLRHLLGRQGGAA